VAKWFETYRGVVNPWECDIVQHPAIAYYFEFFAAATRNLFDLLGEGADAAREPGAPPRGLRARAARRRRL
jgi:acyl-CoA thioesterase FadM